VLLLWAVGCCKGGGSLLCDKYVWRLPWNKEASALYALAPRVFCSVSVPAPTSTLLEELLCWSCLYAGGGGWEERLES